MCVHAGMRLWLVLREKGVYMSLEITLDNMMDLIVQKVRDVTNQTTTDRERFDALRYFAGDITDWLRHRPLEEHSQLLGTIRNYLETREAPADLTDPAEKTCFAQLLALIIEPPPIL
jgi:hypothetical protein